jgi:FkbM family methyltransferase
MSLVDVKTSQRGAFPGGSRCQNARMRFATRAVGAAARRLNRPEWLAAIDVHTRQAQREEIGIAAILATSLHGTGSYIDIGANRGQVLREAVRVAPRGRHIAFEPIPRLADEIARAFPGVDCRRKALGAQVGRAQFCHYTKLDGWSGLRERPEISDERGRPERIAVEVSTLDAEIGDLHPSVVKIDVEGAELAVLEGGTAVLREARPLIVFEHVAAASVLYGAAPEAPWELLGELDYEIFSVTGAGPFDRAGFVAASEVVNWLAVPRAMAVHRATAPVEHDSARLAVGDPRA